MTTIQDQHFTFVLVLTDGVCNDMDDLATTLEKHKDDPVCFVVTCVGPLRMETQYYFGVCKCISQHGNIFVKSRIACMECLKRGQNSL